MTSKFEFLLAFKNHHGYIFSTRTVLYEDYYNETNINIIIKYYVFREIVI